MSQRKLNSDYQNKEHSDNQGRRSRSRSIPIACVKCNMVFFDDVSLVLHFGSHLPDKVSTPGQHNVDLASSGSESPLSLSLSLYSSPSGEMANEISSLRANNSFRPSHLPVSFAPTNSNYFVLNSMPPINSSFDAQVNVSQPIHYSAMNDTSLNGSALSSTCPSMYSQLGPRTFDYGPRPAPHLRLPEQYAGRARFRDSRILRNNQPEKAVLIDLSDSDEKEVGSKNSTEEIDLTLKL